MKSKSRMLAEVLLERVNNMPNEHSEEILKIMTNEIDDWFCALINGDI